MLHEVPDNEDLTAAPMVHGTMLNKIRVKLAINRHFVPQPPTTVLQKKTEDEAPTAATNGIVLKESESS